MKVSNWLILAILAVAAGFFLWLWYFLSFNFVDDPFDLVLAIVWWGVTAVLVVGIHTAEKKRQKRIRTAYLTQDALFNTEAGLVSLDTFDEGTPLVDALEYTLAGLKYSFKRADLPEDEEEAPAGSQAPSPADEEFSSAATVVLDEAGAVAPAPGQRQRLEFERIVRTDKFDKDDTDKWEGEVVDVKTKEATPFKGKEELEQLLAA